MKYMRCLAQLLISMLPKYRISEALREDFARTEAKWNGGINA